MRIISTLYPNERGYNWTRSGTDNFDKRGNFPLLSNLTQFETYGDGNTQHSGDWCVQADQLTDACLSLTAAILVEKENFEGLSDLNYCLNPASNSSIAFALSVQYKEGKRQWYSAQLSKISSAERCANDRRYEEVRDWHNGTAKSAIGILSKPHWNFLQWVALVFSVREYISNKGLGYTCMEDISDWFASDGSKLAGDWHSAFTALKSASNGVFALASAKRQFESAIRNSVIKSSRKTITQEVA